MSLSRFWQTPPHRRPAKPTPADWMRMARHPSAYAPTAGEVLTPPSSIDLRYDPDPFLRAVFDDPAADAPRLAFAEWIAAIDPPRAEFIRAQIAGGADAEKLLSLHGSRWAEEFAPWGARDIVYRRGFAEGMSLTGRSFISLGTGLFERTRLREVRLIAVNFLMDELVRCPHLAKLAVLDLSGNRIGDAGAERLLECAGLAGVRELRLASNDITDGTLARLRVRFGDALRSPAAPEPISALP
jgi:uncharacterized protein (TIGR02996 family)